MIWRIIRWKKEGWAAVKQRRKIKAEAIGVHSRKDTLCMCVSVCYTIFKDIWQLTESPLTTEVIKELLYIKSKLWVSSGALPHRAAVQINYTL